MSTAGIRRCMPSLLLLGFVWWLAILGTQAAYQVAMVVMALRAVLAVFMFSPRLRENYVARLRRQSAAPIDLPPLALVFMLEMLTGAAVVFAGWWQLGAFQALAAVSHLMALQHFNDALVFDLLDRSMKRELRTRRS